MGTLKRIRSGAAAPAAFWGQGVLATLATLSWLLIPAAIHTAAAEDTGGGSVNIAYQGTLSFENSPAEGVHEMEFRLFTTQEDPQPIATFETNYVGVTAGRFSTQLTFPGAVFGERQLWIEMGVRRAGIARPFSTLQPRTPLAVSPQAAFARRAAEAKIADTLRSGGVTLETLSPSVVSNLVWRSTSEAPVMIDPTGKLLSATNLFSANADLLQAAALPGITQPGIYYVSVSGNDATAIEGRMDKPWGSISNAVVAARSEGGVVRVLPGDYWVSGGRLSDIFEESRAGITIRGKTNFVLEGIGTVTIHNRSVGDILMIEESANVTVRGLRLGYETKPASTNLYNNGPLLFGVVTLRGFNHSITVRDLEIFNYPDHGIGTHHDAGFTDGLRIQNIISRNSGTFFSPAYSDRGDGNVITIFNMANVVVEGVVAEDYFRGVEFFAYDQSVSGITNIVVRNCRFTRGSHTAIYVLASEKVASTYQDISIENCVIDEVSNDYDTVSDFTPTGILVSGGRKIRLLNNAIRKISLTGYPLATIPTGISLLGNLEDVEVRGCSITDCGTGITTYDATSSGYGATRNLRIIGNEISDSLGHGMIVSSVGCIVSGNRLWDNGSRSPGSAGLVVRDGIFKGGERSRDMVIEGNYAFNSPGGTNQTVGIWIGATNAVYVSRNLSWNNAREQVRRWQSRPLEDEDRSFRRPEDYLSPLPVTLIDPGPRLTGVVRQVPAGSLIHSGLKHGGERRWNFHGRYTTGPTPGTFRLRILDDAGEAIFDSRPLPVTANVGEEGWEASVVFRIFPGTDLLCEVRGRVEFDNGDGRAATRIVPHGARPKVIYNFADTTLTLEVTMDSPGNRIIIEADEMSPD